VRNEEKYDWVKSAAAKCPSNVERKNLKI